MKHLAVLTLALSISAASTAQAGNLHPPIIDQNVIIEDTKKGSSSFGVTLVALTGLLMLSVIASR